MTNFIRRFREVPTLEQLTAIEQIALVDGTPRTPVTGSGPGALMLIGEFEDGPFNEPSEIFGSNDELSRFGGFGFSYGDLIHQNPAARRHLGEDWNGSGYLKGKFLRPPRKILVRVDTSVGEVQLSPLAAIRSGEGPFRLSHGDQMSVAVDGAGAANTTAVAAIAAAVVGGAFTGPGGNTSGFAGGEQITVALDGGPTVTVTFLVGDQTPAQVAARINAALGTIATALAASIDFAGFVLGSTGSITLAEITAGALASIGLVAATTNSVGSNVANVDAVTATEVKALFDTLVGATAIVDGASALFTSDAPTVGSLNITSGTMALALGIAAASLGVTVNANEGAADSIPAGTRVRNVGADEWVTMQTVAVPIGTAALPNDANYPVKVRPANDNGTAATALAGTVTSLVDQPAVRVFAVTNGGALAVALTEPQLDVAYEAAFDSTLDVTKVSNTATVTLAARRTDAVMRKGRSNATQASDEGNRGRVFHGRAALGVTPTTAIADVVNYRKDRHNYTYPGWRVRIPEIAAVGIAGGQGFTADGVIIIGADGPLAYLNTALKPEQNPGHDTGLLDFVLGMESMGVSATIALYAAFKANGICAPRMDRRGTPVYQSEVTTDLTAGRTTQKRRKMADFIQDSLAVILLPFSKRLATDAREAGIDAAFDNFLGNLLNEDQPELQRIKGFSVVNTTADNPDMAALGISARKVKVQMLSSLDTFLVDTEIGEGVIVTREA